MYSFTTPYPYILLLCAVISIGVVFFAGQRRESRGAKQIILLAVFITIWVVGNAFELSAVDFEIKRTWAQIEYFGIVFIPVVWFLFALSHSHRDVRITHYHVLGLCVIPLITLVMVYTTDRTGLLWTQIAMKQDGALLYLDIHYGLWFWVHSAYSYGLIVVGTFMVLQTIGRRGGIFRRQTIVLLIAVFAPWVSNILYVLDISPIPHVDITPFTFIVSLLAFTWGILDTQLVDLAPFAREFIFEHFNEGIIVFDHQDYATDMNTKAAEILAVQPASVVGKLAAEILEPYPGILEAYRAGTENLGEVELHKPENQWFAFHLGVMKDRGGKSIGRIVTLQDITQRKRTEQRLLQMSRAVEASPLSIMVADLHGKLEYVNPKYTEDTGFTLQDVQAINPPTVRSGFAPPEHTREMWDTVLSGQVWTGAFLNRRRSGELIWEQASYSPILDENGVVTDIVAVRADITEERRLQDQLALHNHYLSVLHDITINLLNRHSVEDLLQAVTEQAVELMGMHAIEILLREGDELVVAGCTPVHPLRPGARLSRSEAQVSWKAIESGTWLVDEKYSVGSSANQAYINSGTQAVAVFPVKVDDQVVAVIGLGKAAADPAFEEEELRAMDLFSHLTGLLMENARLYRAALQEIAERKRNQELLEQSEQRYRQIVENASDFIYRLSRDGKFTYVNEPIIHLLGYESEQQILSTYARDSIAPEYRSEVRRILNGQMQNRIPSVYLEFQIIDGAGALRWVGQNSQLIREGEQVTGLQAVARDITEIKQAEESLRLARDQALEASQLKSKLLANVSHELRTPLSVILGYSDLLRRNAFGPMSDDQLEITGRIIESVQNLTTMVNNMLDEAQLSARKAVLHLHNEDPLKLLEDVVSTMQILADRKRIKLSGTISGDLPESLLIDVARVKQILVNLIGNAIKYTNEGEIRVTIRSASTDSWELAVEDTGIGIPDAMLPRVFDSFFQVEANLLRENRGAGLGLAITRQLVELMGGTISVESRVGFGSKFTVSLPRLESSQAALPIASAGG